MAIVDIKTGKPLGENAQALNTVNKKCWSRRDIIKGGLAGIIAAGVSPSLCGSITRGIGYRNLAGRMASIGVDGKLSAKSYLQTGLVHQWDAIENIGYGSHDNNSLIWKDLKGGFDATINGGYWCDNVWNCGNNNAGFYGELFGKQFTCEFIFFGNKDEAETYATPLTNINDTYSFFRRNGLYIEIKINNSSQRPIIKPFYKKPFYITCSATMETYGNYYDGTGIFYSAYPTADSFYSKWQIAGNEGRYLGMSAKYYSLRIYDRVLSIEELLQNYEIDKARFGLP